MEEEDGDSEDHEESLKKIEGILRGDHDNIFDRIGHALILDDVLEDVDDEDDDEIKKILREWLDQNNTEKERDYLKKLIETQERPDEDKLYPTGNSLDPKDDPLDKSSGVLLRDQICYYVEKYSLIQPFDETNLKPASYSLRVGDQYSVEGENYRISGDDKFEIPPGQVAIIKTKERVNMPHFLIGRWNVTVDRAYDGLLWLGGPQVDPGYSGYLFCPIYNLSSEAVKFSPGDSLARIDFVKTTGWNEEGHNQIPDKIKPDLDELTSKLDGEKDWKPVKYKNDMEDMDSILFQDYDPEELESGLFSEVKGELDDLEEEVNRLDRVVRLSFAAIATILAVLFSVLSAVLTNRTESAGGMTLNETAWFIGRTSVAVIVTIGLLAGLIGLLLRLFD